MDLLKEYEKFLKENKNYTKKASDEILTYRDTKITKLHLISLYMTLKRKHARTGFVLNGFKFGKGEGAVHVNGLVDPFAEITEEQIDALVEALADGIKTLVKISSTLKIMSTEGEEMQLEPLEYERCLETIHHTTSF